MPYVTDVTNVPADIIIPVSTVPNFEYNAMLGDVAKTKPQKRGKWKGSTTLGTGQKVNIYYSPEPLLVQHIKTHLYIKASLQSKHNGCPFCIEQHTPVISLDQECELSRSIYLQRSTATVDIRDDVDMLVECAMKQAETYTGNHYRNHAVKVPTAIGEPVRA